MVQQLSDMYVLLMDEITSGREEDSARGITKQLSYTADPSTNDAALKVVGLKPMPNESAFHMEPQLSGVLLMDVTTADRKKDSARGITKQWSYTAVLTSVADKHAREMW